MFPLAATVTTTAPTATSLVATSLPENFTQRVPYTSVPPSVSSVQIYNNARGNGSYIPVDSAASYAVPVVEGEATDGAVGHIASTKIPAAFLAQIIGQGVPAALQGALSNVLASYDQLVANSFVKYKPSNAAIPPAPPSGVFGRLLAQETVPRPVQVELPPVQSQPVSPPSSALQTERHIALEIRQPAAERVAPQSTTKKPGTSSVKAAISYLMSEARVDLESPPTVKATA